LAQNLNPLPKENVKPSFEQFIKHKTYILGTSPKTAGWYSQSLRWLPSETPTQSELDTLVTKMLETGHKPTGVNCVARAVNSYLHWKGSKGSDRRCDTGCKLPRIRKVREPKEVMPTYTEQQITILLAWRPKTRYQRRLALLIRVLFDLGCRIGEALSLRIGEIDMDNLLITLDGKTGQRIVPMSPELRRAVHKHMTELKLATHDRLLGSDQGTEWTRRNVTRDIRKLCRSLGFEPHARSLHSFRHSVAVASLRRGASVFHVQNCSAINPFQ
jgi:integrase/recombinase XerD